MTITRLTHRRPLGATVLIAVLGLGLAGCATTEGAAMQPVASSAAVAPTCGPGTTGTIEYANGSVAPPYHYGWVVDFTDHSGSMTLQGGYDDSADARWAETFDLTRAQASALCRSVIDAAAASDPSAGPTAPGSSSARVTLSDASGARLDRVLVDEPELADGATALVPDGVWAGLEAKFRAWSAAQR